MHCMSSQLACEACCSPRVSASCQTPKLQAFANLQACTAAGAPTVAPPGVPAPPPVAGTPPPPPPPPAQGGVSGGTCFGFVRDQCCTPARPSQCVCAGALCAYVKVRCCLACLCCWLALCHLLRCCVCTVSQGYNDCCKQYCQPVGNLYNCAAAPLQASDNPLAYGARGIGNEALPGSICTC